MPLKIAFYDMLCATVSVELEESGNGRIRFEEFCDFLAALILHEQTVLEQNTALCFSKYVNK
jgi:hypothetical protein